MQAGTQKIVADEVKIEGKSTEEFYLIAFGDTHFLAPGFSEDRYKAFEESAKKYHDTNRAYFIHMGDIWDPFSAKERAAQELASHNMHSQSLNYLNDFFESEIHETYEKHFKWMDKRLVGILQGNHDFALQSGITGTQKICDLCKCRYLSAAGMVRLSFNINGTLVSIDVFARHRMGKGTGGRLPGGQINKVWHMTEIAVADIYLLGHAHQIGAFERSRIRLISNATTKNRPGYKPIRIKEDKIYLGLTGSFLRGYEEGKDSYVVDAGYPPSSLGALIFTIKIKRKKTKGKRDTKVIINWGVL